MKRESPSRAKVWESFTDPVTQGELAKKAGVAQGSVCRYLHGWMDAQPRKAHVVDWRRTPQGGPPMAVYAKGDGQDAPCLFAPDTVAERAKRAYEKRAAEGRARHTAKHRRGRPVAIPHQHPLVALLFGMAT